MQEAAQTNINKIPLTKSKITVDPVDRIIAVWALSEAALGGFLHALRLPFTGLFVGGMAVLFITMLARFDSRKYGILRATLMVMIVKILVSPHAPVNAYIAITFQGLLGTFLFRFIKNVRLSAMLLGIFSLLQSALQKLLIITFVFGINFWKATDLFADYVIGQLPLIGGLAEHISLVGLATGLYVGIHLSAGILIGFWAPLITHRIKTDIAENNHLQIIKKPFPDTIKVPRKKRSRFGKRLTYSAVLIMSFSIFFLSYIVPVFEESRGAAAVVMILRSVIILALWYYLLGPFLMRKLRGFLEQKESRYKKEVSGLLDLLPVLRHVVVQSWKQSGPMKNPGRIPHFVQSVLLHILTVEL